MEQRQWHNTTNTGTQTHLTAVAAHNTCRCSVKAQSKQQTLAQTRNLEQTFAPFFRRLEGAFFFGTTPALGRAGSGMLNSGAGSMLARGDTVSSVRSYRALRFKLLVLLMNYHCTDAALLVSILQIAEEAHGTKKYEVDIVGTHCGFSFIAIRKDVVVGWNGFLTLLVLLLHNMLNIAACIFIKELEIKLKLSKQVRVNSIRSNDGCSLP
jgi:hypothetical protein